MVLFVLLLLFDGVVVGVADIVVGYVVCVVVAVTPAYTSVGVGDMVAFLCSGVAVSAIGVYIAASVVGCWCSLLLLLWLCVLFMVLVCVVLVA